MRNGNLQIKKLHPSAIIPDYPREGSSGLRLFSMSNEYIMSGGTVEVGLGFAVQLPLNTFGLITNSSYLAKIGVTVYRENIDEDFVDEVRVKMYNHSPVARAFKVGTVIGYLTIVPYCRKKIEIVKEF